MTWIKNGGTGRINNYRIYQDIETGQYVMEARTKRGETLGSVSGRVYEDIVRNALRKGYYRGYGNVGTIASFKDDEKDPNKRSLENIELQNFVLLFARESQRDSQSYAA